MENRVSYNTFYASWYEAMKELTDEQYGRLSRALNDYCFCGIETDLEGIEKIIFKMALPNINASINAKIEGKKGGAPTGNKNAQKNNPPCFEKQPPLIIKNNPPCENETTNGDGNGEEKGNVNDKDETENNLSKLFLSLWQKNPKVFNIFSRIENFEAWERYWKQCNFSPQYIETAVKNVVDAVLRGDLGQCFVPATPDRFILKGWLQRGQDDFKSPETKKEQERVRDRQRKEDQSNQIFSEHNEALLNKTDLSLLDGLKQAIRKENQ
jgi:hypothetical protein